MLWPLSTSQYKATRNFVDLDISGDFVAIMYRKLLVTRHPTVQGYQCV